MSNIFLSVITINLNNKAGLQRTAETVAAQTGKNFEWIVIDGGSIDGSVDVIKQFEKTISTSLSEKDKGIYNAMNKGIKLAKGQYCLFLNSGDSFSNNDAVERLLAYNTSEDLVYFNRMSIDNGKPFVLRYPEQLTYYFFFARNLGHQASIIKRSTFEDFGYYNEDFKIISDWAQMVEIIFKHNCTYKYIDDTFTIFERGGVSTTLEHKGTEERHVFWNEKFPLFLADYKELQRYKHLHSSSIHKLADKFYYSALFNWYRNYRAKK